MGLSRNDYIEFMKKYIYISEIPKLFNAREKRGVTPKI